MFLRKNAQLVAVLAMVFGGNVHAAESSDGVSIEQFLQTHCTDCHDQATATGGLSLEDLDVADVGQAPDAWERVLRRLERRQMPPLDMPRPQEDEYQAIVAELASRLDQAAATHPNPGRTDTFRRLTRTEYGNAIRDLLALEIDVTTLLPADESSHGFDNVTVGNLSPTLLSRYISAARQISQIAVGGQARTPMSRTVRLRPDITQEQHVEGLPLGTRGGTLIAHSFPRDGVYEIQVRLMRDRDEHVEGLNREHELQMLLDREVVKSFTLERPNSNVEHANVDAHLTARITVPAGPHQVGVTFLQQASSLLETKRQPYDAHYNFYRHPRLSPAIYQVSITGPYESSGAGDSPSRRRIFICRPENAGDEETCARRILSVVARRAYRRSITDADLQQPLAFYHAARNDGDFESGIQSALSAILVNPNFLFRIEHDPSDISPETTYPVSDTELASRLAFFLWSSLPDDELLELAERGVLNDDGVLASQVRRMLRDERSRSLVTNFAGQWLHLRNLDGLTPDLRAFPDFDDNLRQAFRQETELFFESILREDRSALDLIDADYTFLNERLATHYNVPHIYGSHFRRVSLGEESRRGGLLRQGSILMATSYATRTSPVIRGKWVLENLMGSPPPPPPDNVPPLEDNTVAAELSVRDRLAAHRANPACASCHNLIDPVGLSLENFDAVGRWRDREAGAVVDASGGLPDGSEFVGVEGLEQGLLARPEIFVGTLAEKLLTFALGRGVEPSDGPAVREILREAEADDYRFSSLIVGIARSTLFRMRRSP